MKAQKPHVDIEDEESEYEENTPWDELDDEGKKQRLYDVFDIMEDGASSGKARLHCA